MFGKKQDSAVQEKPASQKAQPKSPEKTTAKTQQKTQQKTLAGDSHQESLPTSGADHSLNEDINLSPSSPVSEGKDAKAPIPDSAPDSAPDLSRDSSSKSSGPKKDFKNDELNIGDMLENSESENSPPETLDEETSLRLQEGRGRIWLDLRDGIDLKALARMDMKSAREEIKTAVEEIVRFRSLDLTATEIAQIAKECADDMLGFGPLEPLLERDNIADIMINGPETVYIEVDGKIERAHIKFRDNQHLTTICQRIVGAIGRRVDEASPICDARLMDGSRVNVIIPPLAVDGSCMTIRKFTKEKLTLEKLVGFGSMTPSCAKLIMAIGRCRVNTLVSGGTGSGKTTMLNCLTRYIELGERVITCEDACELQLQQPHVVRLETRPPNLEGVGEVTMRDLVKNCLRMRPDRIIVGEVRGPEAFDLLQAMNTGHDGSMGTVHANNPREAVSRMENMIAMGGLNLPTIAVREQIASAVQVIIQVQRLRDGSRKVTNITEISGMEGEVVTMQDLFKLEIQGEDDHGKLITELKSTGMRPRFFDKAKQYGVADMVMDAMDEAYG